MLTKEICANLTPFIPELLQITCIVHWSTLHFAEAGSTVYKSSTWEKTWQVESLMHMEQYHLKFVEKTTSKYNIGIVAVFAVVICIPEQRFCASFHLYHYFRLSRRRKCRSPCSFKRKWAFISLSSLAWGKFPASLEIQK